MSIHTIPHPFIDHLQERKNELDQMAVSEDPNYKAPEQYEHMVLNSLIGNYDDAQDYENIIFALASTINNAVNNLKQIK